MRQWQKKILVFAGAFGLVFLLDAGCIFYHLLGVPCLGCGQTRAWMSVFRGNFARAFYWHPLFWLTPILLLMVVFNEDLLMAKRYRWLQMGIVMAYVAVFVWRMVLYFPHTAPMTLNADAPFMKLLDWLLQ